MAARLAHGSATPPTLDLQLHEMSTDEIVPRTQHATPTGAVIGRYIHGTRYRRAKITLILRNETEVQQFRSFYRTAENANSRFSFVADTDNAPTDTWSAFFTSLPVFERIHAGAKHVASVSVEITDAPLSL